MKTDTYTLEIDNATEADAGEYLIKAVNDNGTKEFMIVVDVGETKVARRREDAEMSATLEVKEMAKTVQKDVTQRVESEAGLTLQAEVSQESKPTEPAPTMKVSVDTDESEITKKPEMKVTMTTDETEEAGAAFTIGAEITEEVKPTEPKIVSAVATEEVETEVKKAPEAKITMTTDETAETGASFTIGAEVTEETEAKLISKVTTEEKETEVKKAPEPKVSVDTKEVAEAGASFTVGVEVIEEEKPTEPKIVTEVATEEIAAEVEKKPEAKVTMTTDETAEAGASFTVGVEVTEEVKPTEPKIVSEVATKETPAEVEKKPEAKVTMTTEETAETGASFTVGVEVTEEVKPTEAKIVSEVTTDETEAKFEKKPEAKVTMDTKENVEAGASFTLGEVKPVEEDVVSAVVKEPEAKKPEQPEPKVTKEAALDITEKTSETAEMTVSMTLGEGVTEETTMVSSVTKKEVMTKEGVMDVSQETTEKISVSADTEATMTVEGVSKEVTEAEVTKMIGVQKDVTQIASGLKIVSVEGSEESESSSEESSEEEGQAPKFIRKPEPAVVDIGKEIRLTCQITGQQDCSSAT